MLSLRLLPFRCVFDILFRHEAIDTIQSILGQDCMMCGNSRWSEVITACCIVRRLENPAHALLLLCPPDRQIVESVRAWSVSHKTTGFHPPLTLRPGVLIRAMKVFLGDKAFEWMDGSCIKHKFLPLTEWEKIAKTTIANYHISNRWWRNWKLDCTSIRGSVDESIKSIGPATAQLAKDEKAGLMDALKNEEKDRIMETKLQQQQKRPKTGKPPPVPRITLMDTQIIEEAAARRHESHLRVLKDVEAALRSMRDFSAQFQRTASLIVRLGYEFPLIKWSLRLILHEVAVDIEDMPPWPAIYAMRWRATDADPLQALVAMRR